MGTSDQLVVYGAAYGDAGTAIGDFEALKQLYADGEIGSYDAAVMTKEPSGMIIMSNADSTGHFKGGAAGALVGGVLGVVFPPSVLAMGALGAAAGAAASRTRKHLGRSDMKELGELLNPGESGVLLVTDRVSEWASGAIMPKASRRKVIMVEGDTEAIKAAIVDASISG